MPCVCPCCREQVCRTRGQGRGGCRRAEGDTCPSLLASAFYASWKLGSKRQVGKPAEAVPTPRRGGCWTPGRDWGTVPEEWLPVAANGGHSLGLGTRLVVCCRVACLAPLGPEI